MHKNIEEFVAEALNTGTAAAPRWWVLRAYKQARYSKTITAKLQRKAENKDIYGDKAGAVRVFDTVQLGADVGTIVLLAAWTTERD